MASARKKQDEKNLKTLREIVSFPGNKHCFDCNQRGPTYVNMTIGSFVCTKCSGMLRGLRPPHRVKSISMATFTQEEVDFVKSHGNEHCRQTWLALYDQKLNTETKDEEEIKEFMMDKYELKRYYHDKGLQNGTLSTPVVEPPEPAPFVRCVWNDKNGFSVKEKTDARNIANSNNFKNTAINDFVADFNSANIFNTSQFNNNTANTVTTQASFANFDNNVIFNSANVSSPPTVNGNAMNSVSSVSKIQAPPSEDRYAALKDLDNALKVQMQPEQPLEWSAGASSNGSGYTSPLFGSPSTTGGSMYGSPSQGNFANFHQPELNNVSNPFALSASPRSPWSPSAANGAAPQPANNTVIANNCFPAYNGANANPFRTTENGFNATTNKYNNGTNGFNNSGSNGFNNTNGYNNSNGFNSSNGFQQNLFSSPVSSSQFNKPWSTANPFALGISPTSGSNSNNPFL